MKKAQAFTELTARHPLALLPVRLETKYFTHRDEDILGLRIYPDTIHADDHRRSLTTREAQAGQRFWEAFWWDDTELEDKVLATEAESQAWLAQQVGTHRSVYVANRLRPKNVDTRNDRLSVAKKLGTDPGAPEEPAWPDVDVDDQLEPVTARLLPDEWHVRICNAAGKAVWETYVEIPEPELVMAPSLMAGFDTQDGSDDPRGAVRGFLEDQDLNWTVDFDAALDAGMAVRIRQADIPNRIKTLLVTGVRSDRKVVGEAGELFDQFANHRFSRGLDLVPQGTPTNNSDAGRSGISLDQPDVERLFEVAARPGPGAKRALLEHAIKMPQSLYLADGADALSLAFGRVAPNALDWTEHAFSSDGAAQWAMNVAVGYPVIGGFLAGPLQHAIGSPSMPPSTALQLQGWYASWVRGGAALPTLRCGEQPYGVLPITTPPRTSKQSGVDFRVGFENQLVELLDLWRAALPVPHLDPDATDARPATDAAQSVNDVASVLGAVPNPTAFQLRDAFNNGPSDRESLLSMIDGIAGHLDWTNKGAIGAGQQSASGVVLGEWNDFAEIIDPRYGNNQPSIDAQLAAAYDASSRLHELEEQYDLIESWIRSAWYVVDNDLIPLLALRSAMSHYLPAVLDVLHDHGGVGVRETLKLAATVFDDEAVGVDDLVGVETDDYVLYALSRWRSNMRFEYLQLVEDKALHKRSAHADESSLLVHLLDITYQVTPEAQIPFVLAAFTVLNRIVQLADSRSSPDPDWEEGDPFLGDGPPTISTNPFGGRVRSAGEVVDMLERLLRETLGLAMYRLDAWVLSLANERLALQRKDNPYGVNIGAYGWLVDLEPSDSAASQGFIHAPSLPHATTAAVLRAGWSAYGTADADAPLSVNLSSDRVRDAQWILDGLRNGQDLAEVLGARFERLLHDADLDVYIAQVRTVALAVDGDTTTPPNAIVDGLLVARAAGGPDGERTEREAALAAELGARLQAASGEARSQWEAVRVAARAVNADLDSVADVVMLQSVHSLLQGDSPSAQAAIAISSGADASIPPIRATASDRDSQLVAHRVTTLWSDETPLDDGPWHTASPSVAAWLDSQLPPASNITIRWNDGIARNDERLTLGRLGLSSIDAMMLAGDGASQAGSDLARVIDVLAAARSRTEGTVDLDGPVDSPDVVSVEEFGLIAARLRDAMGRARPIAPADLVLPSVDVSGASYDLGRSENARAGLWRDLGDLRNDVVHTDEGRRRRGLVRAAALGITGALAALDRDGDITLVVEAIEARQAGLADPIDTAATDAAAAESVANRLGAAIGSRLPVPTWFTPVTPLADGTRTTDDVDTWMRQVSRVRASVAAVSESLLLAGAVGATLHPTAVVQFPSSASPWVATGKPPTPGDQLSVVVVNTDSLESSHIAGLLFDSWTESIPRDDQPTGIAVHFDSPSARPPQSILLSTVESEKGFTVDDVCEQLLFTLELAKLRAVGPVNLGLGQLFPAVYLPEDLFTADDRQAREATP